ncbi:MAG: isoprenylcysteine carboxylmethyltransferase family protein [Methanobacteriota archaeon]
MLGPFFALLLAERAFEVWLSRRNERSLAAAGGRRVEPDGFGLLVAGQTALFAGTFVEWSFLPWGGAWRFTVPLVVAALILQCGRYWAVASLGPRWTTRVVVVPGAPPVTRGPYRFLRHPNYVVVVAEAFAIPLAFGAFATAAVVGPAMWLAVRRRVRLEEAALCAAGPYDAAFGGTCASRA